MPISSVKIHAELPARSVKVSQKFTFICISVAPHRNSQMLEEEETLPVPPDPAVDLRPAARLNQEEPPPSAAPEEDEEAERPFKVG